ncbi:hypothetical protein HELRODRAFT_166274 [Helobdella robusta]|uniref:Uncharacterized protein n=1 Tax=Helobdella robusta TaxID=6412 RepID=T1EXY8_HELRO|nr:hypothetical protein HELRODRAFT_166274 [Helobdella robusta]ESN90588.1 hypothetical protein HELRODRAFT_166274 [Helobdella robusta]
MELNLNLEKTVVMAVLIILRYISTHSNITVPTGRKSNNTDTHYRSSLQKITADPKTGNIYVGGMNQLLHLTSDLELVTWHRLGPMMDNPNCPPPNLECRHQSKSLVDSWVKVILIDQHSDRLIVCVNLFQGHCKRHSLMNVSLIDEAGRNMVVPNDETSSVTMLLSASPSSSPPQLHSSNYLAPPPSSSSSSSLTPSLSRLYVAATRSLHGSPVYRSMVPSVSIRNHENFELIFDDGLHASFLEVEIQHRDSFRVNYIHSFQWKRFVYFLTVQKSSVVVTTSGSSGSGGTTSGSGRGSSDGNVDSGGAGMGAGSGRSGPGGYSGPGANEQLVTNYLIYSQRLQATSERMWLMS